MRLNQQETLSIGVDIDEVLLGFLDSFLKFYNKKYSTNFQRRQFFSYDFWQVTGQEREKCYEDVHEFFETEFFKNMQPLDGAYEAMSKLKNAGNRLIAITSRQLILIEKTRESLEKHFPGMISGIEFGNHYGMTGNSRPKTEMCRTAGVSTLIEDSLIYAKECAKHGIDVVLMDSPWNQTSEMLPSKIIRVSSWQQALDILEK